MTSDRRVVLDTSVVSILLRPQDPTYSYYQKKIEGCQTLISFQTLQESWYGAYNANWGDKRRAGLGKHISRFDAVWPSNELVDISADLRSKTRKIGRELKVADAWIACTAIMLHCPLVAHDRDFSAIQSVACINIITQLR